MIHYRKLGKTYTHPNELMDFSEEELELRNNPILTYCNWSYALEHHIRLSDLISAIQTYNKDQIFLYERIFNEIPVKVTHKFLVSNNLEKRLLINIYNKVSILRGVPIKREYWTIYNETTINYAIGDV